MPKKFGSDRIMCSRVIAETNLKNVAYRGERTEQLHLEVCNSKNIFQNSTLGGLKGSNY